MAKAFCHEFYWPTALEEATALVDKCEGCQCFSMQSHLAATTLKTIPLSWPFAVWGLDMVGPFKTVHGGMTHLLVVIDKFTKWIEAKPIKKLDGPTTDRFIKDIPSAMASPTASSPTTTPTSPKVQRRSSVPRRASGSTLLRSRTHSRMARRRWQTA